MHLKATPPGRASSDWLAAPGVALGELPTPVVTVSEAAVAHNLAAMARWCARAGVDLAPHGKTTMSRALWERQLGAGAWAITVATPWQARVALAWGMPRVLLANEVAHPAAARTLAQHADRVLVWADSVDGVAILHEAAAAAGTGMPLPVLVDLGAPGGRTGARTVEAAVEVARAVAHAPALRLAGVAGYEGALAHGADERSRAVVVGYLAELDRLHQLLVDDDLYPEGVERVLTAGGSVYPDLVAEVLGPRHDPVGAAGPPTRVVLRSGAYLLHDDGFYRGISPLHGEDALRPALHGWATVISRPEPGLAILDAGKRDLAFDEGLPEPQLRLPRDGGAPAAIAGARVRALNDQHAFLEIPPHSDLAVGDVVRLGLSHPCTTMDKWRALPLIDDDRAAAPAVIGVVETEFG